MLQKGLIMRINAKGQVTIPAWIRREARLLPNTEVEIRLNGEVVIIEKLRKFQKGRGARMTAQMRGRGNLKMSTDEIMALMRGRKPKL